MPGCDFAHVQDDMNPHVLRMVEGTPLLDEVLVMFTVTWSSGPGLL